MRLYLYRAFALTGFPSAGKEGLDPKTKEGRAEIVNEIKNSNDYLPTIAYHTLNKRVQQQTNIPRPSCLHFRERKGMRSALSLWPLLLVATSLATIAGPAVASSPEPPLAGTVRGSARRGLQSAPPDDDPRVLAGAPDAVANAGSDDLPTVQVYVKASGNSPYLERSARLMRECTSTAPAGRVTFLFDNKTMPKRSTDWAWSSQTSRSTTWTGRTIR